MSVSPSSLGHLRTKLPGFERSLGEAVHEMVNYHRRDEGQELKKVHGWIEVKHADPNDKLTCFATVDWVAYIHARVIGGTVYTVPVIPDEFNPRPDKIVRPEDKPYVFKLMHEAEDAANKELPGFVAYIEGKL